MRARKIHGLAATLAILAGGCDVVLGLEHRELYRPDGGGTGSGNGTGTTSTGTSSASSSSGTGGSNAQCVLGQKQCAGTVPQKCDANGQWQSGTACHLYCDGGACVDPASCVSLAETCGPASQSDEYCCASPVVVGGMYNRINDAAYPATVSDFRLDRFEITVGRFRAFVNAYDASPGSKPTVGVGAHPKIAASGWQAAWNTNLASDQAALTAAVKCDASYHTWTDAPGANEDRPMNCISWFDAFAFCAWDGGRLPTEAEWNYAAAGGGEQWSYPWGEAPPDMTHAVYDCTGDGSASGVCAPADIVNVGAKSSVGDGRWKQTDLAGGVWEWTLDEEAGSLPLPCSDCAVAPQNTNSLRVYRGGAFDSKASFLLSSDRPHAAPGIRSLTYGARCARTP